MSLTRDDQSFPRCSLTQHSPHNSWCHFVFTVAVFFFFFYLLLDKKTNVKHSFCCCLERYSKQSCSTLVPLHLWVSTTTRKTSQLPLIDQHGQITKYKELTVNITHTQNTDMEILVQYCAETCGNIFWKKKKNQSDPVSFLWPLIKQKHFGSLLIYLSCLQPYQRDRSAHFFPGIKSCVISV